ncbi:b2619 [Wigglesworthia glossinidia endosymbiont of Glossina brevipalpis]|uniref:B2619 protein n=1 Tax=Wigglesworthia glossinidia brevipalpis TaxID=36870 RepID=Q8D390_WIGBR|nr:b2619 [Wigglesworthia glossinidia endosymbiont of Glossina brevipalpis]
MTYIIRCINLPYEKKQIFEIVNNVDRYSKFLPWCTFSKVLKKHNNILICETQCSFLGIKESFITKNTISKNTKIVINLISGSFNYFLATWNFYSLSKNTSQIKFELTCESKYKHINIATKFFLKKYINNVIYFFLEEAKKINIKKF